MIYREIKIIYFVKALLLTIFIFIVSLFSIDNAYANCGNDKSVGKVCDKPIKIEPTPSPTATQTPEPIPTSIPSPTPTPTIKVDPVTEIIRTPEPFPVVFVEIKQDPIMPTPDPKPEPIIESTPEPTPEYSQGTDIEVITETPIVIDKPSEYPIYEIDIPNIEEEESNDQVIPTPENIEIINNETIPFDKTKQAQAVVLLTVIINQIISKSSNSSTRRKK